MRSFDRELETYGPGHGSLRGEPRVSSSKAPRDRSTDAFRQDCGHNGRKSYRPLRDLRSGWGWAVPSRHFAHDLVLMLGLSAGSESQIVWKLTAKS